eukprot:UN06928
MILNRHLTVLPPIIHQDPEVKKLIKKSQRLLINNILIMMIIIIKIYFNTTITLCNIK